MALTRITSAGISDGVIDVADISDNTITGAKLASDIVISTTGSGTFSGDLTVDTSTLKADSATGRVGVGTANPDSLFHVYAATTNVIARFESGDANVQLRLQDSGTVNGNYIGAVNDDIYFQTNGFNERMRIDSSGNVGIGTTSPSVTFDVEADGATVAHFNRTTSDGDIVQLQKDGTEVGVIGTLSSNLYVGSGDTGIYFNNSEDNIYPINTTTKAGRDNAINLGKSVTRFKDLYLSGSVYLGGTGSANALDDYEEGTWTPTLGVGSWGTVHFATYTKIGKIVYINARLQSPSNTTNTGSFTIEGLPFTQAGDGEYAVGSVMVNYITTLTNDVDVTAITYPGNNILRLFAADRVGGNWDAVQYSFLSSSTTVYLSLWYNTNT